MKKLFCLILFCFATHTVFAETDLNAPKKISVNVAFKFNENGQEYKMKNKVIIFSNNPLWAVVQEEKSTNSKDHFVLLCKAVHADHEKVELRFLLLDKSDQLGIVTNPKMVVAYGQKGKLKLSRDKQTIQLAVVADA